MNAEQITVEYVLRLIMSGVYCGGSCGDRMADGANRAQDWCLKCQARAVLGNLEKDRMTSNLPLGMQSAIGNGTTAGTSTGAGKPKSEAHRLAVTFIRIGENQRELWPENGTVPEHTEVLGRAYLALEERERETRNDAESHRLAAEASEVLRLDAERERNELRKIVNVIDGGECDAACDSFAHDDDCPVAHPIAALVRERDELLRLLTKAHRWSGAHWPDDMWRQICAAIDKPSGGGGGD